MITLVDQQNDQDFSVFHKILGGLQDEVLLGALNDIELDSEIYAKLPMEQFALPELRKFPVNSAEDALLSKLYFEQQRPLLSEALEDKVAERISTFLNLYNLPEEVFAQAGSVKEAAEEKTPIYLLPEQRLCRVAGTEDLVKAAQLFEREKTKLPIPQRVEFSQNFVKSASTFGLLEIPCDIAKYASCLDTDLGTTRYLLDIRAAAVRRKGGDPSVYVKLASLLGHIEVTPDKEELSKLASLIYTLDKQHGLDAPAYDRKLPCAYTTVFNQADSAVEKQAAQEEVPFRELTKAELVARYGEDLVAEVEGHDGEVDYDKLQDILHRSGVGVPGSTSEGAD
ncbi:MAG: hypothetical protein LHW56_01750 [Candidatus Cloacimonetes bacterium]|nr:hypothetical protein [Candidatus Cloacimonadota bacterium]MDY0171612.1 hypothetical protein [Candidatus Cloacimonadaceae bacterium]